MDSGSGEFFPLSIDYINTLLHYKSAKLAPFFMLLIEIQNFLKEIFINLRYFFKNWQSSRQIVEISTFTTADIF